MSGTAMAALLLMQYRLIKTHSSIRHVLEGQDHLLIQNRDTTILEFPFIQDELAYLPPLQFGQRNEFPSVQKFLSIMVQLLLDSLSRDDQSNPLLSLRRSPAKKNDLSYRVDFRCGLSVATTSWSWSWKQSSNNCWKSNSGNKHCRQPKYAITDW